MKLLILSDLHLEFHPMRVPPGDFDAVVLAGDIQAPGRRGVAWAAAEPAFTGKPVLYVPGNHEFYGQVLASELAEMHATAQGTNVQVLDQDVVTLASDAGPVRVLGATLWTDFRLKVLGADGQWRRDARLAAAEAGVGLNDSGQAHGARVGRATAAPAGHGALAPGDTALDARSTGRALGRENSGHHTPCAASRLAGGMFRAKRLEPGVRERPAAELLRWGRPVGAWAHARQFRLPGRSTGWWDMPGGVQPPGLCALGRGAGEPGVRSWVRGDGVKKTKARTAPAPTARELPSIWLCGDVHGRFDHLTEAVLQSAPSQRPAALVLLGDLQAQQPLEVELAAILEHTEVWFIPGNHDTDTDEDHDHLFCSALAGRNLHGRVVEIAGVRIAGLGGVFRGQVWMPPGPPEVYVFSPPALTTSSSR
jgi:predicted phosphodiesterase